MDHCVKDDDDDEKPQEEQPQPRVSDWSLEVEEEEERLSHVVPVKSLASGVASSEQLPQHRGGIIRLPPEAMTSTTNDSMAASGSQSGDWRAHPPPPHHPQVRVASGFFSFHLRGKLNNFRTFFKEIFYGLK